MKDIPQKLIKEKKYIVTYVVYLDNNGEKKFFYLATRYDKLNAFKAAIKQGNFDPEDHGIILEEGKGEASDFIKEKMELKYDCNHEVAKKLEDYELNF